MTDFFPDAVARLIATEGGFVDNPRDPGGATKYGITLATLARWRGAPAAVCDVKALTVPEAEKIYRAWYWLPLACDMLQKPQTPTILLDAAALFGLGGSARAAQRAANACGAGLLPDGHVGPKTVAALNALAPAQFAKSFQTVLKTRIGEIVAERPASQVFRHGWESRVERYTALNF
jgi:lysozyme family protein